ncbi:MAG: hypothetical protein AAGH60_09055 [Pseudomonadota bacterium]
MLHGPNINNFPEIYSTLTAAGAAIRVDSAASLAQNVAHLFTDVEARERQCHYARRAIQEFEGSLDATVDAIEPLLMAFSVSAALDRERA